MKKTAIISSAVILMILSYTSSVFSYNILPTAKSVNLSRYIGTWYEIAAIPNYFQKDCFCTTVNYSLPKNANYMKIYNFCRKGSNKGKISDVNGKGFVVKGSGNAKLRVQFFWPFRGDYWIIYLNKEYKYAMVGEPSRERLWIISRKPKMSLKIYNRLKRVAQDYGYDTSKLKVTDQSCYTTY